jgi:SAM-dependent methyltransferase
MSCRSFFNPSGFVEEEWFLKAALDWHISVHERNIGYSNSLFDNMLPHFPHLTSLLEIGCGTGTLLKAARNRGIKHVMGFDLNRLATEYGKREYGLVLNSETWTAQIMSEKFDLILCISVLEHLEEPRLLFKEISEYCRLFGSCAYISVPFVEMCNWHFLQNPDPNIEKTPFFDNDCHIIHFSRSGFKLMCRDFGSTDEIEVQGGAWRGFLIRYE